MIPIQMSPTQICIQILLVALSLAASLIGGIVLWNLRCLAKKLDTIDKRVDRIEDKHDTLAEHVNRTYVDKIDYIREVTRQRDMLESIVQMVSEMKGSIQVVEKLPQIAASVAREVVKEMKES